MTSFDETIFKGCAETLAAALKCVTITIEKRGTIPILHNAAFHVDASITATDMDQFVSVTLPETTITDSFTVDAAKLLSFVNGLTGEIKAGRNYGSDKVTFICGNESFDMPTRKFSDFPIQRAFDPDFSAEIGAQELFNVFSFIEPAISQDESRYYLRGLSCHGVGADGAMTMNMVATDGHTMALAETNIAVGDSFNANAVSDNSCGRIIPHKAIKTLLKIAKGKKRGNIKFSLSSIGAEFEIDNVRINTKLIDGTFPDYRRVMPSHKDASSFSISAKDAEKAATRILKMASNRAPVTRICLEDSTMSHDIAGAGKITIAIPVKNKVFGSACAVGINGAYIKKMASMVGIFSDTIESAFDGGNPTIHKPAGIDVEHFPSIANACVVVMPMRLGR